MMTADTAINLSHQLFRSLADAGSPVEADRRLLGVLAECVGARQAALWRPTLPDWSLIAAHPRPTPAVPEAVAEALDLGGSAHLAGWSATPLSVTTGAMQPDVLAIEAKLDAATLTEMASLFEAARSAARQLQRGERLDELLGMSIAWSASSDTVALLEAMAESATRLFAADRATIFLWDKRAAKLVGRPALGLPGNQLVIPEDAGVVGKVVQTGTPRRVGPRDGGAQVDRSTDTQTGYRTKSLLCVPLDAPSGERLGAFELINKKGPTGEFNDDDEAGLAEFAYLAAAAVASAQQLEDLLDQRDTLIDQAASGARMLGESPAIAALRKTIDRVAESDLSVLVLGENGTGKEVVAQSLHFRSPRRAAPLLAVNCAAIAESLLESELFGHEAGAFTDARESRAGKFELADGGTLLLDEIGDMSLAGQAKLLRVLEDKTVVRVGGAEERRVDVRVVAATNRDLSQRVREKSFREDLFYRLCVVTLELPPLRDRGEDVLLLAEHFLRSFGQSRGRKPPKLSAGAKKRLLTHNWPGNVRELRNLMERVAYLTDGPTIGPEDLSIISRSAGTGENGATELFEGTLTDATNAFQRAYIDHCVDRSRGNVASAARQLGLHRSNLYRKMRHLGLEEGSSGTED
ncbi:sigma-54-dependent Fis family transcriptional regulator [Botrimarina hoheduenensis]|uniref:Anaerobic nitric oxide reductase transcription regulator NorR n=1 Tax=Botrimarina hoheduenensis TaxID=2528000 RepID=A0A5C5VYW1_9BACT|nr:sigma-54-dependent Fis family transcriptional regulator [Botrimarina hoheduenensis]TWT42921.1 Anaerobic nitric oxide reductase transcription regulator NorR [Botrimarina hoheduenensis]